MSLPESDVGVDHSIIDAAANAFANALRENAEAEIEEFLPACPNRLPALVEMVREAIQRAWMREPSAPLTCVDDSLSRFPELAAHPEIVAELRIVESQCRSARFAPGATFAEYTIERELGRGAMGVVYQAIHGHPRLS